MRARSIALLLVLAACVQKQVEQAPIQAPVRDIIQADATLQSLSLAADGRHLARLSKDGKVVLFDMLLGKEVGRVEPKDFLARHFDLGPGLRLALAGAEGLRIEHPRQGTLGLLPKPQGEVDFVALGPAGEHLLVGIDGSRAELYRREGSQLLRSIAPPDDAPGWHLRRGPGFGVTWVHDDGRLRWMDARDPALERQAELPAGGFSHLQLALDACVFVNAAGQVETRSLRDGTRPHRPLALDGKPEALALSPDASVLAVDLGQGRVRLFDLARREPLLSFQSSPWAQGGIRFTADGHFLAWIEQGRRSMRYWAPGQGVVQWTGKGAELRPDAVPVCDNLAKILRFGLAVPLVKRAQRLLEARELEPAMAAAREAVKVLETYPGLLRMQREIEERLFAFHLGKRLRSYEAVGNYRDAVKSLEEAIRERTEFDGYGFKERLAVLQSMLQHFDAAEAAHGAGRKIDAILAFREAVKIIPDLLTQHPRYQDMEREVLQVLPLRVQVAQSQDDDEAVLLNLSKIRRLRSLGDAELLLLGQTYQRLGKLEPAKESLAAVAEAAKEYEEARFSLARMARSAGDLAGARAELEKARKAAPGRSRLEREFAEVCELLGDVDAAVTAWASVGQLEKDNPKPMERIAELEAARRQWQRATLALRSALQRDPKPRPQLLLNMARMFEQAGAREKVLSTYQELIKLGEAHPEAVGFLGEHPRQRVENWIRNLGYVRSPEGWIRREQFLIAQGWVKLGETWLRPEEEQLHSVARRYQTLPEGGLRAFSDARYQAFVSEKRVSKGMTRREVLASWGFFADANRLSQGGVEYQQLIYASSRKVYLRDGLVCFWTE